MGVTSQLIEGMYRDYALADKVYRQIISDINPEISDDLRPEISRCSISRSKRLEKCGWYNFCFSDAEKAKCYHRAQEDAGCEASEGERPSKHFY